METNCKMTSIEERGRELITSDLGHFVDRLYFELCKCTSQSVKQGPVKVRPDEFNTLVFDNHKYYDQAVNYQKVLILSAEGKPESIPFFPVYLSDLSSELKEDLNNQLGGGQLRKLLKVVVLRFFQNIDDKYNEVFQDEESKQFQIHLTGEIAKVLKVRLVP